MDYTEKIFVEINKVARSENQRKRLKVLLQQVIKNLASGALKQPAKAVERSIETLTEEADEIAEKIAEKIEE